MRKYCRLCGGSVQQDPLLLNGECANCGAIEPAYGGWDHLQATKELDRRLRERPHPDYDNA